VELLQAKLALVELNISEARQLFDQTQQLAEDRGLQRLALLISIEHDTLLTQLSQWEAYIEHNVSLSERAELAQLEAQVVRMLHKRVPDPPEAEIPEFLLILDADSGLSIFSKAFHPSQSIDEHLFAGFLTAIDAFGRDTLATSGIERIKYADYTLLLQPVAPFMICYVFQGPSYFALQKITQFSDTLPSMEHIWQGLTTALQGGRVPRSVAEPQELEGLITQIFSSAPS